MSKTTLDEILAKHNGELGVTREDPDVVTPDTKQAILDWHYKQVEEVIKKPHILPTKNAQHQESVEQCINFYHRQMRKRVDKLKEANQ